MQIDSRKEALLNEYKGNLFEFLVAVEISKLIGEESRFLKNLNPNFSKMLKQQESYIRNFFPDLLLKLPNLAKGLAKDIYNYLDCSTLKSVELIGKSAATSVSDNLGEADLIIEDSNKSHLISIKLSKFSAATNTKSAGVKSFISKYFNNANELQKNINNQFDKIFDEFSFSLHDDHGLEWDRNFNEWTMRGLPTLPGELKGKNRDSYLSFIHKASTLYFNAIKELSQSNNFHESIYALIGFSHKEIIQATCYHKNNYADAFNQVLSIKDTLTEDFSLIEKEGTSYFELRFKKLVLIIRIKAMNKFINKSFKVNCSVKYL